MQSLGQFFKGWVLRSGRLSNSAQMDSDKTDFNGLTISSTQPGHPRREHRWRFGFCWACLWELACSDKKAWKKESLLLHRLAWLFRWWVLLPYCYCCCRFDDSSSVFQHELKTRDFLGSSRSSAPAWVHWHFLLHGATTSWFSTSLVWDSHCWTTLTTSNTFPIYSACWLFL